MMVRRLGRVGRRVKREWDTHGILVVLGGGWRGLS